MGGQYFRNPICQRTTLIDKIDACNSDPIWKGSGRWKSPDSFIIRDGTDTIADLSRDDLEQIFIDALFVLRRASLVKSPEDMIRARNTALEWLCE